MDCIKKKSIIVITALVLIFTSLNSASAYQKGADPTPAHPVDAVFDLCLRPVGLVATGAGAVLWVVALPFTLPSRSVHQATKSLIIAPGSWTFNRPLGKF